MDSVPFPILIFKIDPGQSLVLVFRIEDGLGYESFFTG